MELKELKEENDKDSGKLCVDDIMKMVSSIVVVLNMLIGEIL